MKPLICNPLNLEYRYQIKKSPMGEATFREAADPTMVLFKEKYLLFASMSGGFWYSSDLIDWEFKETPELPIYDYAPDVREVDGRVIFSASKRDEACSFFASDDPINKPFEEIASAVPFWDPDIFQDEDGRVFFYWGCSNNEPIYGIEVDRQTFAPIGEKVALISENEVLHGWERKGENNKETEPKTEMEKQIRKYLGNKPFIEGAFMTKHNGIYYLQYAAPGTECNVYADGVYIGQSPLGPFVYQIHNPFSSKPGGFMTSAGHGSTFQDKKGNWWHVSTMRISVNENFERRIGLFPCEFDKDGILYCRQDYADYPFDLETRTPQLQMLSYGKRATATSSQKGCGPEYGVNENCRNWWAAETLNNQIYELDLGEISDVHAVQVNFADHQLPVPDCDIRNMQKESVGHRLILVKPQVTEYLLEASRDKETWLVIKDARGLGTDYAHDFIPFKEPEMLRYFRLSHIKMPLNGVPAVSGLRVFGKGSGEPPQQVNHVKFTRENRLNTLLKWDNAAGAYGYNIRYGIAPDKLYSSWQVHGVAELDLSMVNGDTAYYIAVDSFNENGVTPGKTFYIE